ncbi:TolC family outer membrane protein [Thiomicrospira microaerophila]|uniref:TolC family outer membrane protein n=1 Tax=Thiomicrospira microaerophila TaxID=406020 RepID=UPI00200C528A|nr:TolC family outer membrane protein [Thiomicrospira microaerophila]UQB43335.1 TolC family outer membrane protein [Thiomicrospira microaerophila]
MKKINSICYLNVMRSTSLVSVAIAASISFASFVAQAKAPGLVDVYQMSVLHDAKLAQARASFDADREVITQARSLLLPTVNASAVYSHPDLRESSSRQVLEAEVNQAVFNREAFSRYDQAQLMVESAEINFQLAQQDLMMRVSSAYFDVLLAEQKLTLAKSKMEADKILWERAQASAEVGLASRTDVLQARSAYDITLSNLISAENDLDIAYESLSRLTGQSLSHVRQLMLDVSIKEPALNRALLESQAKTENLLVRLAKQQQRIANEEIEAKKSAQWVNVNLRAAHSYTHCSGDQFGCNDGNNTSLSLMASVPLYTGGRIHSQVDEARFKNQASLEALRDAQEQARLNIRVQVRNMERGYALVGALREAVKSGEAFLEAAEEGYRVGLRNMIDVVTARANLFDAQSNLAAALHNLLLTQLQLQSTLGRLSVDDLRELDLLLTASK